MKKITITVPDAKAATIMSLVAGEAYEISMTHVGDDPVIGIRDTTKRTFRGDKKAEDLVLEMFDENNHTRTTQAIQAHLIAIGFAAGTHSSVISKLVHSGRLLRVSKDTLKFNEVFEDV